MNLPLLLTTTDVSFPGIGLNNIPLNRVAFTIGSFPVYWYGICIILAFGLCIGLAMWQASKFGLKADDVIDVSIVVIPSAIVGARLYYVASAWDEFAADPISVFNIRNGGLAVLGGVLFSILAVYILTKFKKKSVAAIFDFLIVYIPLGQAIGRWGNFFNQEAFGTNTTLPWGMISADTSAYISAYCPGLNPDLPVHPTFLYESLATLLIFFVLLFVRKRIKLPLVPVAMYFILYGAARFFIEGLRTDSLYIGNTGLRTSQVLSAVLVVVGFGIIALSRYQADRKALAAHAAGDDLNDTVEETAPDEGDQTDETGETGELGDAGDAGDTDESENAGDTTSESSDLDSESSDSESSDSESSDSESSDSDLDSDDKA